MMKYFIDVAYDSLKKHNEELCGDKVEIVYEEDAIIIVLADGLGSGVKANILATMTTKIAGTMLKEGASIHETIDTIAKTLPVCNVRKLAYSTFSIVKIQLDGSAYIIEYHNPAICFVRNNKTMNMEKIKLSINEKNILESRITLTEGDLLTVMSDGVVHAGVGGVFNLGWQWENVAEYLEKQATAEKSAKSISKNLIDTCRFLYDDKPGDDATVVTIKIRKPETIDLFTGPPEDEFSDGAIIKGFMKNKAKKIVCGGTAAKIVGRELNQEVIIDLESMTKDVPPMARIKGIDLVTEGVLTLTKVVEIIKLYTGYTANNHENCNLSGKDGASILAKMLIEDCTHLNLWVGKAINPAHQNPDLPLDLSIKLQVINELSNQMKNLGKKVFINYI